MLKPPDVDPAQPPTLDLDALMERVRAEVNARKSPASVVPAATRADSVANLETAACSVDALMALPDAEFVRAAYVTVFARDATEAEFTYNRDRLFIGTIDRGRLLGELLKSEEARRRGARIEGFSQRALGDAIRRSAPARWTMNAANTFRTIYLLPRRIRQFLKRVDGIERTAGETSLRANQLSARVHSLEDSLNQSNAKIALLEQELAMLRDSEKRAAIAVEARIR